jgi:hypothetical protein
MGWDFFANYGRVRVRSGRGILTGPLVRYTQYSFFLWPGVRPWLTFIWSDVRS